MTPALEEAERLLRLAQHDEIAFSILADDARASFASAAFHGQQAVEKAIKAVLSLQGIDIPRTHDLDGLGGQAEALGMTLPLAPRRSPPADAIRVSLPL